MHNLCGAQCRNRNVTFDCFSSRYHRWMKFNQILLLIFLLLHAIFIYMKPSMPSIFARIRFSFPHFFSFSIKKIWMCKLHTVYECVIKHATQNRTFILTIRSHNKCRRNKYSWSKQSKQFQPRILRRWWLKCQPECKILRPFSWSLESRWIEVLSISPVASSVHCI